MTTTVTAGNTASFQIGPFDTITLSSANGVGGLALTSQAPKLVADQALSLQNGTFGPWGAPMSVVMTVSQGSVGYDVNARSLTVDQTVAAQALVSGDGSKPGTLVCDWATGGTLSLASANGAPEAAALDSSVLCDGLPMLKCTVKASTTFIASFDFSTQPRMAQMRTLQIPIKFSSNVGWTDGSNPVQVWFYNNGLAKQWRVPLQMSTMRSGVITLHSQRAGGSAEGWTFAGGPASSTELDVETIQRIRIVIATPAGSDSNVIWVGPLRYNGRRDGLVSVVLDGEYDSQQRYILPMLNGYGLRSSLALTFSDIGGGSRMTQAQIDEAYSAGHEVIHHTFDATKTGGYAVSAQWADAAAITADLNSGQDYLTARGWTRGRGYYVHGFSYPFDQSVSQARQEIVATAYTAAGAKAIRKSVNTYSRLQSAARTADVDPYVIHGAIQVGASAPAVALTLGATSGATTATAGSALWSQDDVGRAIYAGVNGAAITAAAVITSVTSTTVANIAISTAFAGTSISSGTWTLAETSTSLQRRVDAAELNGELAVVTLHRATVGAPQVTVTGAIAPTTLEICAGELDTFFQYLAQRQRLRAVRVLPFGEACVFAGLTT